MTREIIEGRQSQEPLTNRRPNDRELWEMLAITAVGIPPILDNKFTQGLAAAAEEFPPLARFIDKERLGNELSIKFFEVNGGLRGVVLLNNGRDGIVDGHYKISKFGLLDFCFISEIKKKMEKILTPQGREALKKAAEAVNKVWGDPTLCPE